MGEVLLTHEPLIRPGVFAGVLALMASWELLAPRRSQAIGRSLRWPNNLGIVALDTLLLRLIFPTAAVSFAVIAQDRAFAVPPWLAIIVAVPVMDLPC